jgi:anti-anti-sigma regulatory factor
MTTVRYEADTHRLRIEGACRAGDRSAIQEALDTFARLAGGHLIVDLTAVTTIDQRLANDLVDAAHSLSGAAGTFAFVRKHGTAVDDAMSAAEARGAQKASS